MVAGQPWQVIGKGGSFRSCFFSASKSQFRAREECGRSEPSPRPKNPDEGRFARLCLANSLRRSCTVVRRAEFQGPPGMRNHSQSTQPHPIDRLERIRSEQKIAYPDNPPS
jgi:hypothetical protein